jgi:hypothetical protein
MIYVTTTYSDDYTHIENVWDVNFDNVEELYKNFIIEKSIEMNIIINKYWLNIMDFELFHKHLTKTQYNNLSKKWKKFLRLWNKDKFIFEKLNGLKLEFKCLSN